jgi:hypothetical protein
MHLLGQMVVMVIIVVDFNVVMEHGLLLIVKLILVHLVLE